MAIGSNLVSGVQPVNNVQVTSQQPNNNQMLSAGILKDKGMSNAPVFISIGEIIKKMHSPKERKEGFALLKMAFEKIINAKGAKPLGASCEVDEKKQELIVIADGNEFAKITADYKSVYLLQNGENKSLGNFDLVLGPAFKNLISGLAALHEVNVEFASASV